MKRIVLLALVVSSLCVQNELEFEERNFVAKVIDGDTIELRNEERIRLIGMNAPDSGEKCFKESKEKLEELIFNENVNLEKDITNKDSYGRSLRYIYLGNSFVNLEMVKTGYAYALTIEPNVKYSEQLTEAEGTAEESKAGCLWS